MKKSYIKMDKVYEIPIENLEAAGADGRQFELQSKSWDKVQDYIRKMNDCAIQPVAPDSVNNTAREGAGLAFDVAKLRLSLRTLRTCE